MKDLDEQISTPESADTKPESTNANKRLIRRLAPVVAILFLIAVIMGGVGGSAATFYWMSTHGARTTMAPRTTVITQPVSANIAGTDLTSIYNSASPAIVSITSVTTSSGRSRRSIPQGEAGGTGFIVNQQGNILTNYHVVQGASKITITLYDGTTLDATVAGSDPSSDLALLKASIPTDKIAVLTLGNSDQVVPGEPAIAIGNPFGLDHTITAGIISGVNREFGTANGMPLRGLIQTDAPINPGNSGGPLFDAQGEVIGITSSIESPVQGSVGIGFAIPINKAKQLLPQLQTGQSIDHPYLGISGGAITPDLAGTHSFSADSGVLVVQVDPNGPAAKAGIKGGDASTSAGAAGIDPNLSAASAGGDIITEVDGNVVKTVSDISNYINAKAVGDTVTLTVNRNGQTIKVNVTLGAWPASQLS